MVRSALCLLANEMKLVMTSLLHNPLAKTESDLTQSGCLQAIGAIAEKYVRYCSQVSRCSDGLHNKSGSVQKVYVRSRSAGSSIKAKGLGNPIQQFDL